MTPARELGHVRWYLRAVLSRLGLAPCVWANNGCWAELTLCNDEECRHWNRERCPWCWRLRKPVALPEARVVRSEP